MPINGLKPNLADIRCGVPLCSILSTLLFLYIFFQTEILTQILFSKSQKILKFNGKAGLETVYSLLNVFEEHCQKSFLIGSHYLLNLTHIKPDGKTKNVQMLCPIVPNLMVEILLL